MRNSKVGVAISLITLARSLGAAQEKQPVPIILDTDIQGDADDALDAAILYRQVLAAQADGTVVMVSVGQLTNFKNLLITGPDGFSDLTGVQLVGRKVSTWVCMGGKIPEGREANFVNDGPAAEYAVGNWPTPIVFSGYEIGKAILTGARLRDNPTSSPTRRAFELYNGLRRKATFDPVIRQRSLVTKRPRTLP